MTPVFFCDIGSASFVGPLGLDLSLRLPEMTLPEGLLDLASRRGLECLGAGEAFTIEAVSAAEGPLGIYFFIHGHAEGTRLTHLQVRVARKPGKTAPVPVMEGSAKVGGYPAVLDKVFRLFPANAAVEVPAEGHFYIGERPPFRVPEARTASPDLALSKKSVTYALNGSDSDSLELYVLQGQKGFFARVKMKIQLTLSPSCIEDAAAILCSYIEKIHHVKAPSPQV